MLCSLNFVLKICIIIKEKDEFKCFNENTFSPKYIPLKTDDMRNEEHMKLLLKILLDKFDFHDIFIPFTMDYFCRSVFRKIVTRPRSAHKLYNSTINLENLMQIL